MQSDRRTLSAEINNLSVLPLGGKRKRKNEKEQKRKKKGRTHIS